MDKGELPEETLRREIQEEWGEHIPLEKEYTPSLLTITTIANLALEKIE